MENHQKDSISSALAWIRAQFRLDDDQADYDQIDQSLRNGVHMRGTNLWVLVFAILIASIGLNVNSTAVIIGAMLISPLMGPIMGVGYGIAIYDFPLAKASLKSLGVAVLISLAASTLYFMLTPLSAAGSELLARTSPTIWDVLIALFGGLAGIIGATRAEKNNTVPGVAIATALMPPLCTASYGIATANWMYFLGAFYLFVINSVFIAIATFLMVSLLDPPHRQFVDKRTEMHVKRLVSAIAVATLIPSVYLAYSLVQAAVFRSNAGQFIKQELVLPNVHVAEVDVEPTQRRIEITLIGIPLGEGQLAELRKRLPGYHLQGSNLIVHQSQDTAGDVTSLRASLNSDLSSLRSSLLSDLYKSSQADLVGKETRIRELEQQLESSTEAVADQQQIARELLAQYPVLRSAALSIMQSWQPKADQPNSVLVVRVTGQRALSVAERRQITNWLRVRTKTEEVSIFEDG